MKKIIENIISGKILVNEFNSKNIDILISYLDRDDDKFVNWVKSLIGKQFKNKKITLKYYLSDIYVGHDLSSNNLRGYDECRIYNNNNMKNREINTLIEIIIYYLIFMYEVDNKDWNEYISGIIGGRIYEQYQYIKNGNFTKYINKTELVNLNTDEEINFIFYSNSDSTTVDICVNGDKMYLNSDFLFPLKSALLEFATSGLILFNNKIRKNRNIFKKRFYRSYDIINDSSDLFPLNNN